jgi:hypothetical protein
MSFPSVRRGVRVASLLGTWCAVVGCGATGLDWVAEARLDSAEPRASVHSATGARWAGPAAIPAAADPELALEAHPRLNRTITLGEMVVAAPAGATDSAPPGFAVTVNNYNSVNVSTPNNGYGYGYFAPSRAAQGFSVSPGTMASRASGSGIQPGQNWPAVSAPGTSFPYRSAPASPWGRTQ